MKIEIHNKLQECWTFVGEYMECAAWESGTRTEVILPGAHEIGIGSPSMFTGLASGYIIYVSDDQEMFLVIMLKQNELFASVTKSMLNIRQLFESFSPFSRPSVGIQRSEGCYWTLSGGSVKLVIFGPDMSVLSQQEVGECSEAEYVGKDADMPPTKSKKRSVRISVKNRFKEPFSFDGDWIEGGEWRIKPKCIENSEQTTDIELEEDFAGSVTGSCWFVSKESNKFYLSISFANKPMAAFSFCAWAGEPPFDIRNPRSEPQPQTDREGGIKWSVDSSGSSSRMEVSLEVLPDLIPYDPEMKISAPKVEETTAEGGSGENSTSTALVPTNNAETDKVDSMVTELMNSTRPKNALVGLGSGLKYIGGGIVAGAAALVSAPVIGAKEEGGIGLLKGVAKGVGGFVGLTVAGAAVGVTQVVRGIANTPEAFAKGSRKDFKWDKEKGEWVKDVYLLRDLIREAEREEADSDDEERNERVVGNGIVKETEFYEILGVKPEATTQDIKKAYYKQAMLVHPDKNPNDPNANKTFQKLSQAYQVLSDPESRSKYDVQGSKSLEQSGKEIDQRAFFSALFGSLKFEPYVGELSLSGLAKQMMNHSDPDAGPTGVHAHQSGGAREKRRERRRRIFCAKNLKNRLEQFVTNREEAAFIKAAYLEAHSLSKASFGLQMLRTLGWVYTYRAEKFIADEKGNIMSKKWASWKSTGRNYSNMAAIASNVTKAFVAVNKMSSGGAGGEPDEEQMKKQMEASLPVLLETAWSMCQVDIEVTAKAASKMVLKDVGEAWQIRIRRAHALQILGRVFEEVGLAMSGESAGPKDPTADQVVKQLEQAFLTSTARN